LVDWFHKDAKAAKTQRREEKEFFVSSLRLCVKFL